MTTFRVSMLLVGLTLTGSGCVVEVKDPEETSEEDPGEDKDSASDEAPVNDADPESAEEEAEASESSDDEASADASTPIYARSECGDLKPSDHAPSSSASAPTGFAVGELVTGQLDPEDTSSREHFLGS